MLAFLSNGLSAALIDLSEVVWLPLPRFDSSSVFSKVLDRSKGGSFSLRPLDGFDSVIQQYLGDSLVLETTYSVKGKKAKVVDFMPLSLPGLVRIYESEVPLVADVRPAFNYGLINPSVERKEKGLVFRNPLSSEGLELYIDGDFEPLDDFSLKLKPGKGSLFLLYSRDLRYGFFAKPEIYGNAGEMLRGVLSYFRTKLRSVRRVAIYEREFYRSVSVILGLMYRPSGAIVASPTTSLPEIVGEERNWDYRFAWVRDMSYAIEALVKAGLIIEARYGLDFLISVADPASKTFDHPLYTVDGTPPLAEEVVGWLSGYEGSKPVRIGNAAYLQIQMDVEGAFMNALHEYVSATRDYRYVVDNFWIVESLVEWVSKSWKSESTDIWEERGVTRHYVHTKVMSWVALDRASRLARTIGNKSEADEWEGRAEEIKEDVMRNGVRDGQFVRYYGGDETDAALLTLPIYGFVSPYDERFLKTFDRIRSELEVSPYLYLRYKRDFMGNAKNPFVLVTLWVARVLIRMGKIKEAEGHVKRLIECSTPLGLLGEHVEPTSCEPRGNFPHLFSHSGMVTTIAELDSSLSTA